MTPELIAQLKEKEKQRFLTTYLPSIFIKRAPWSDREQAFGYVISGDVHSGGMIEVFSIGGGPHHGIVNSLDELLEHWIGD